MKIVCISDTHGFRVPLPKGNDILIHAGDVSTYPNEKSVVEFAKWILDIKDNFKHIILVPGNHDSFIQRNLKKSKEILSGIVRVLVDEELIINNIKFYGTPWTPRFMNWAFMFPRGSLKLQKKIEQIPDDTNVLITHGPPWETLDLISTNERSGCELLANRIKNLKVLKLHVFGHFHFCHGVVEKDNHISVNATICDDAYNPVNKVEIVEIWRSPQQTF